MFDAQANRSIVEKDPGFAAILIEESIRKWGIQTEITSLSAKECGEKIRMTMSSWIKPLDILAEIIAPVDNDLSVLPIGVKKDNEWLTTSWYRGTNSPPKINILEISRNEFDWPNFRGARPGDKSNWYWRWTLEELRDSLSKVVKNKSLPLFEGILYKELMWRITLKIINQGSLYTESICLDEIKLKLDQEYQHIYRITLDNKYVPMSIYRDYVAGLESKNILVINCPLPGRDINNPKGNLVWSSYSDEQLYFRTLKIYKEAILGYKELVEIFFPVLKQRLRKYVLYPFILKGEFFAPEENTSYPVGPTMKWYLEPLPLEKTESIVDIRISNSKEKIVDKELYEIARKIKDYRPDSSAWLGASQSSQVLDIFGDMPVTEILYNWLEQDLKSIDWIK